MEASRRRARAAHGCSTALEKAAAKGSAARARRSGVAAKAAAAAAAGVFLGEACSRRRTRRRRRQTRLLWVPLTLRVALFQYWQERGTGDA